MLTLLAAAFFGGALISPLAEKCVATCWPTEPPRCAYTSRPQCLAGEVPCAAEWVCYPVLVNLGEWAPNVPPSLWPVDYSLPMPSPPAP